MARIDQSAFRDSSWTGVQDDGRQTQCRRHYPGSVPESVSLIDQFKRDSKFSTWLYRIAMNTIFSHLKSKQRLHLPAGENSDLVPSSDASAEETLLRSELSTEITKQMQTMKPEYRAAIVLTSFQGLTPGQAAEAVGCSSDTFYWRLNQARNQLRERLADWLKK